MEYHDKWNLSLDEWNILITMPFHFAYSIALADDVLNPEEFEPLQYNVESMSSVNKDCVIVDICKTLISFNDKGIKTKDFVYSVFEENNLIDEDENFNQKNIVINTYLPILNKLDSTNKDMVIDFCIYLKIDTSKSYGRPEDPMDYKEVLEMNNISKMLNVNFDDYLNENNRKVFDDFLNSGS